MNQVLYCHFSLNIKKMYESIENQGEGEKVENRGGKRSVFSPIHQIPPFS